MKYSSYCIMGSVLQGANRYFAEAGLVLPDADGLGARDDCTWRESWSCIKAYTGYGISASANYTTQWFIEGGQLLNSSGSSATVRWNEGIAEGRLQLPVNNQCPSTQGSRSETHPFTLTKP